MLGPLLCKVQEQSQARRRNTVPSCRAGGLAPLDDDKGRLTAGESDLKGDATHLPSLAPEPSSA